MTETNKTYMFADGFALAIPCHDKLSNGSPRGGTGVYIWSDNAANFVMAAWYSSDGMARRMADDLNAGYLTLE